jgi:glyoxylase-like metal-dependent hydrolase (beta-lactamase superfamily II)
MMKKTLVIGRMAMALACAQAAQLAQAADPYQTGFATYAKEIQGYSSDSLLASSVLAYQQEVAKVEKSVGYIGKTVPIPKAIEVAPGIYTVVGSMIWHNPGNFGLNNNLTFMIFEDGVFVFNAGPNAAVAYALHQQIKQITSKPVKWLAVENSQGHAYLGASYWVDQGVKNLYSHQVANDDFNRGFDKIKKSWGDRVGHPLTDSARNVSDKFTTFDDKITVEVGGGEQVEILNFGSGHTPGSTIVYLPKRNVALPGDLAYNQRMLALFAYTNTQKWMESFKKFASAMPADVIVIPGHGAPTNMQKITTDTYDYLAFMNQAIKAHIAAGGTEVDLAKIDQSAYKDRSVYNETYQQNAIHIYKELTGAELGESFE